MIPRLCNRWSAASIIYNQYLTILDHCVISYCLFQRNGEKDILRLDSRSEGADWRHSEEGLCHVVSTLTTCIMYVHMDFSCALRHQGICTLHAVVIAFMIAQEKENNHGKS